VFAPLPRPAVDRSDAAGWLAAVGLIGYVLVVTRDWRVPDPNGLPFGPLWIVVAMTTLLALRRVRGRWDPTAVLAASTVAGALLTDATTLATQFLRDLGIYLRAGDHFASGAPVYLSTVLTAAPTDRTLYPFVYPPPVLPVLDLVAALPRPPVELAWLVGSTCAALAGLRLLGLPWRWSVGALFWPPFFEGLFVGNVAVPAFALFAAAPGFGAGLVLVAGLKPYSGLAALWLVRARRWRAIALGTVVLVGLAIATLPLVGPEAWRAWADGLVFYARSQAGVPGLVRMGLEAWLPGILALVAAALAIGWAWLGRGLDGLVRFGIATVVASPSLFGHGFLVALPAFLALRPVALWLALGITSVAPGAGWWLAIGLVLVASVAPALRRAGDGPWPAANGTV
jgi:Glycosyltransferase family 87